MFSNSITIIDEVWILLNLIICLLPFNQKVLLDLEIISNNTTSSQMHFFLIGYIDMEELLEVVGTFYSMEGVPKEAAKTKAEAIFKSLDTNGDGTLDEDEFCEGVLNDQGN